MSAACLDTFCSRFLVHRKHLHTRTGLQQLVDITSQPQLCNKLQTIQLVSVEFRQGNGTCDPDAIEQARVLWYREERDFTNGGFENALLTELLNNLAACKTHPSVAPYDWGTSKGRVTGIAGFSSIEVLLGKEVACKYIRQTRSTPSTLRALTTASANAVHPMISLDLWLMDGLLDRSNFDLSDSILRKAWSKLTKLEIQTYGRSQVYDWRDPSLSGLVKLLRSAVDLEVLHVAHAAPNGNAFDIIGTNFNGCALRSIGLMSMDDRQCQLMSFLRAHNGSLRHLSLSTLSLHSEDAWRDVFVSLLQEFTLRSFRFSQLNVHDANHVNVLAVAHSQVVPITATRVEHARALLTLLAECVPFEDYKTPTWTSDSDSEVEIGQMSESDDDEGFE